MISYRSAQCSFLANIKSDASFDRGGFGFQLALHVATYFWLTCDFLSDAALSHSFSSFQSRFAKRIKRHVSRPKTARKKKNLLFNEMKWNKRISWPPHPVLRPNASFLFYFVFIHFPFIIPNRTNVSSQRSFCIRSQIQKLIPSFFFVNPPVRIYLPYVEASKDAVRDSVFYFKKKMNCSLLNSWIIEASLF